MKLVSFMNEKITELLSVLYSINSKEVLLLCYPETYSERIKRGIEKNFSKSGREVNFLMLPSDRLSLSALADEVFSKNSFFEISAGRGEALILLQKEAEKRNIPVISYSQSDSFISAVGERSKDYEGYSGAEFTINDLILCNGAKTAGQNHNLGEENDDLISDVLSVSELVIRESGCYARFAGILSKIIAENGGQGKKVYYDPARGFDKSKKLLFEKYIKELEKRKILNRKTKGRQGEIEFKTLKLKNLFTDIGAWLEYYVYIMLEKSGYFSDTALSVKIDWDGDNTDFAVASSEIDVMAMDKNKPLFISCKLSEVTKEALYEIRIMADRFGGRDAPCAVVSCAQLLRYSPDIYKKGMDLGVAIIDGDDLQNGRLAAQCIKAVKGTYNYKMASEDN